MSSAGSDDSPSPTFPWLALLAALALRVGIALLKGPVGTDEALYLVLGHNLWSGKGFTLLGAPHLIFPPLFPWVLGGIERILGTAEGASRIVFVVAGAALVPVCHSIARRTLGPRSARWSAWLVAVSPTLSSYVASWFWGSMSEPLFLLFAYGGWLVVIVALGSEDANPASHSSVSTPLAARHGGVWRRLLWAGLAGLSFAAAFLTRPEGVAYALLGALLLAWPIHSRAAGGAHPPRGGTRRPRLAAALVVLITFSVASAPYLHYLRSITGRWSLSAKSGVVLEMAFAMLGKDPLHRKADLDVLAYEALGFRIRDDPSGCARTHFGEDGVAGKEKTETFLDVARREPGFALLFALANAKDLLLTIPSRQVHPWPLLALSVVGFASAWRERAARRRGAVVVAMAGLPVVAFVEYGILPRFLVPVVPALLILAGAGIDPAQRWIAERLGRSRGCRERRSFAVGQRLWVPVLITSLALFAAAKSAKAYLTRSEPIEYQVVGEWARSHLPANAVLMCRKPEIAFYAQRPMVALAVADPETLVRFARCRGVTHVVLDRYAVWGIRPELRSLFEPGHTAPGLSLLERFEVAGRETLVFSVTPPPVGS